MVQKELWFCGEKFVFDTEARTLTFEIRDPMAQAASTFGWAGSRQGFGMNYEALQFAMRNKLIVNVLWDGQKFKMDPALWLQRALGYKSQLTVKGVLIYVVPISDTNRQGYFDGQQTLL